MPGPKTILSATEARKIILASQGLKHPSFKGQSGTRLSLDVIEKVGYVQIDTISVVQRAHHHVLQSRVPHYQPAMLEQLEKNGKVFEYWSHAASYMPMRDFRFTLPMKLHVRSKDKFWFTKDHKLMQQVLDRMKAEGPLKARDFESPVKKLDMWESPPAKQALQNLFMEGKIMVKSRVGFQKVYDLTERIVPSHIDVSEPSTPEYIWYLIKRDIRAHGLVLAEDIGYLLKGLKPLIKTQLAAMAEAGEIIKVHVGKSDHSFYTTSDRLEVLDQRFSQKLKFLNPFDNALINRARTSRMFQFDYVIEIYVPAAKRKFGYYALPILWKDQLVGQVDMKADRKKDELLIRNLELKIALDDRFISHWKDALVAFATFNGMQSIRFEEKAAKAYQPLARLSYN